MTNARAAAVHRQLDAAQAEALARDGAGNPDGKVANYGALMPPRQRRRDMATTSRTGEPKVLLMQLLERTSARGKKYLSGWLGKGRVVAFPAEPDEHGNPRWDVYLCEPGKRLPGNRPVR